jgi:NADH dehydrogenase
VLVIGGGFGGVYAAMELRKRLRRRTDVEITLVTRDNYFLFTPMLHEVAAGDLELHTIVNPLRKLLRGVDTFVGTVESIDLAAKQVRVSHGADGHTHDLRWDRLVLALGAGTNFFGLPGVQDCALTVTSIGDAMRLRNRLITHLEEASSECTGPARRRLLTAVVAGGGFAGVETLGAINDFVRAAIRFYPNLDPDDVRMVMVTPDALILPELGPELGAYAQRKLGERGVEIITGAKVRSVHDGAVELTDGRMIDAGTLVWTAGTAPNPLLATLPFERRAGRVIVNEHLEVPAHPDVWAIGDCALIPDARTGGFHPPTAQHAMRQGRTVARNVAVSLHGGRKTPFAFSTLGQLAAIGRRTGVAKVFGIRFSGFVAWWLWRTVYLSKLPRFEKKVRVALDWTLDLCFAKDFACVTAIGARPQATTDAAPVRAAAGAR